MATNLIAGRTYARMWLTVLGAVLLLLGVLGFLAPHLLRLHLEEGEMAIHFILGIVTLAVAFGVKDEPMLNNITITFAVIYILVGIVGFVLPEVAGENARGIADLWHVSAVDNVVHLLVGAVTAAAWWMSRETAPGAMAGRPTM